MLVVVKDRDVHPLAAQSFDDETIRGLDVFQVDRAEGRLQRADDIGQLFGSASSTSMSKQSMSANFLNRTALPSITGLEANAPMLPNPSTAVPFVTTATRLPLLVYTALRSQGRP